jgi:hypothetical protein
MARELLATRMQLNMLRISQQEVLPTEISRVPNELAGNAETPMKTAGRSGGRHATSCW